MQGQAKGPLKEFGEWLLSVDTAKYERAARRREEYAASAWERRLDHFGCVHANWYQPFGVRKRWVGPGAPSPLSPPSPLSTSTYTLLPYGVAKLFGFRRQLG